MAVAKGKIIVTGANGFLGLVSLDEIPPIRALILNAGFQDFGKQSWTDDGLDTTFAANYLGQWLFTHLLLGSMGEEAGRFIIIGSQGHKKQQPYEQTTPSPTQPLRPPKHRHESFRRPAVQKHRARRGRLPRHREGHLEPKPPRTRAPTAGSAGTRRQRLFLVMMQHELQARLLLATSGGEGEAGVSRICVLGVDQGAMSSGLQRLAPWVIRVLLFGVTYPLVLLFNPGTDRVRKPACSAGDVLEAAW